MGWILIWWDDGQYNNNDCNTCRVLVCCAIGRIWIGSFEGNVPFSCIRSSVCSPLDILFRGEKFDEQYYEIKFLYATKTPFVPLHTFILSLFVVSFCLFLLSFFCILSTPTTAAALRIINFFKSSQAKCIKTCMTIAIRYTIWYDDDDNNENITWKSRTLFLFMFLETTQKISFSIHDESMK